MEFGSLARCKRIPDRYLAPVRVDAFQAAFLPRRVVDHLSVRFEAYPWNDKFLGKTLSFHKGRGRKIKSGQKVHSSVAFCNESYHPRAILPEKCLYELIGKGSRSNTEWVKGWEDLIEMDIFDLSLMSNVIETLKSGTEGSSIWVHRLTAMTSTGGHFFMLERAFLIAKHRQRSNRLVW